MLAIEDSVVQELKNAHLRIRGSSGSDCQISEESGPTDNNMPKTSAVSHHQVQFDENGLVIPRKLDNPIQRSREHQTLHHEIMWNGKMKIDVLNNKSELERVMEKRNRNRKEQERLMAKEATKTPFEKKLEERAKRLEKIEAQTKETDQGGHSSEDSGHCSPEPESEFLKIHAQLKKARSTLSSGLH